MDTLKIEKGKTALIAHRGLSGIERENTASAFLAAANRGSWGIETDVHLTLDGKFILIHDDDTLRVCGVDLKVEQSTLQELRALTLKDLQGEPRGDLILPTPVEYFSICRRYGKKAVFEFKNRMPKEAISRLVDVCAEQGMIEDTVFISFSYENLKDLRAILPYQSAQYLYSGQIDEGLIKRCKELSVGLDVWHGRLNEETVELLKKEEITINCWTVDDPKRAMELVAMGVDMLTTNVLE